MKIDTFQDYFCEIIVLIYTAQVIFYFIIKCHLFGQRPECRIRQRVKAYSYLSNGYKEGDRKQDNLLSESEHNILLGILKKVESKNSVLTAVIIFIETAVITNLFLLQLSEQDLESEIFLIRFTGLSVFPSFILAFLGIRHVDLGHTNYRTDSNSVSLRKELQDLLIKDLIIKEISYKFGWYVTLLSVLFFFLVLLFLNSYEF